MGTRKLVARIEPRLARLLASRPATPIILTGTLALAGLGAGILTPAAAQHSQVQVVQIPALQLSSWHTFCGPDPDGDGHVVCHILASQVAAVPNLGCSGPDPDHDGTYICYYASEPPIAR